MTSIPLPTRRTLIVGGTAVAAAGAIGWRYTHPVYAGQALDPVQAHRAAVAGDIVLVDIRRPDEWALTGIGQGAVPVDMRREDFTAAMRALIADAPRPVALICARGVRSARMSTRLSDAGLGPVIDVPEGMLGSAAGPGWLERGLPVVTA